MGSIIYSHLNESLLLDRSLIASQFHGISDAELKHALQKYREFCLLNLDELREEVSPKPGKIRLFIGDTDDNRILKQGAFYLDSVIITDPLFKLTEPLNTATLEYSKALNLPTPNELDRAALVKAVKKVVSHQYLVANGYVNFFPTSLESESPEQLPLYTSDDHFESVLPSDILSLYRNSADVRSVLSSPKGLLVLNELKRCRRIHIDFCKTDSNSAFGFDLLKPKLISLDRDSGQASLSLRMPAAPPSQESFDSWVSQSVNRAAWMHFKSLMQDIRWSSQFGAQYMTRSPFTSSVLDNTKELRSDNIRSATTSGLLTLKLPIFDNASMNRLMAARLDEEAFRRFRLQLERHFRELRLETDPIKKEKKIENAMHELTEIQLTEVDSAIRRLKRKGLLTGMGAVASLAAATVTSGASLFATMYAAYSGYKTFEEYRIATKENPAYFLWRVDSSKTRR